VGKLGRQIDDGAGVKNILINSLINLEVTTGGIRSGVNLNGTRNSAIGMRVDSGSGLNLVGITGCAVRQLESVIVGVVRSGRHKADAVISGVGERVELRPGHSAIGCRSTLSIGDRVSSAQVAVPEIGHSPVQGVRDTVGAIVHISGTESSVHRVGSGEEGNLGIAREGNVDRGAAVSNSHGALKAGGGHGDVSVPHTVDLAGEELVAPFTVHDVGGLNGGGVAFGGAAVVGGATSWGFHPDGSSKVGAVLINSGESEGRHELQLVYESLLATLKVVDGDGTVFVVSQKG
jgi:hypothetical protein